MARRTIRCGAASFAALVIAAGVLLTSPNSGSAAPAPGGNGQTCAAGFKARATSGKLEPVVLLAVSSVPCKFVINLFWAALHAYNGGNYLPSTVRAWNPRRHADVTVALEARADLVYFLSPATYAGIATVPTSQFLSAWKEKIKR